MNSDNNKQKKDDQIINDKYEKIIYEMKMEIKNLKEKYDSIFNFFTNLINKLINEKANELQQKNNAQNYSKTEIEILTELNNEEKNIIDKNENSLSNNNVEKNFFNINYSKLNENYKSININNKTDYSFENDNLFSEIPEFEKQSFNS